MIFVQPKMLRRLNRKMEYRYRALIFDDVILEWFKNG